MLPRRLGDAPIRGSPGNGASLHLGAERAWLMGRWRHEGEVEVITLICPVRHCGAALERRERSLVCSQGHSFDLARSGYCNLLQPQDRRSKNPGDSRAAVEARRRLLDAGYGAALLAALQDEIVLRPGAAVL